MIRLFAIVLLIGVAVVGAAVGAIGDPDLENALQPPSFRHLFGTDALGRDVAARLALAAADSLVLSIAVWGAALLLGVAVGTAAGYSQETLLSRVVDELIAIVYATPFFLALAVLLALLGRGRHNAYIALLLFAWAPPARHAKTIVARLRSATHVRAAVALGYRPSQLTRFVLLPQVFGPVAVASFATLPEILAFDVALSFFGLGSQPPFPTIGGLISEGLRYGPLSWWLATFPLVLIGFTCIAIRLTAQGAITSRST